MASANAPAEAEAPAPLNALAIASANAPAEAVAPAPGGLTFEFDPVVTDNAPADAVIAVVALARITTV